jgi:hypothetical protein
MASKYPICDVFHWFCEIARFFATEPKREVFTGLKDCEKNEGYSRKKSKLVVITI